MTTMRDQVIAAWRAYCKAKDCGDMKKLDEVEAQLISALAEANAEMRKRREKRKGETPDDVDTQEGDE